MPDSTTSALKSEGAPIWPARSVSLSTSPGTEPRSLASAFSTSPCRAVQPLNWICERRHDDGKVLRSVGGGTAPGRSRGGPGSAPTSIRRRRDDRARAQPEIPRSANVTPASFSPACSGSERRPCVRGAGRMQPRRLEFQCALGPVAVLMATTRVRMPAGGRHDSDRRRARWRSRSPTHGQPADCPTLARRCRPR